MTRSFVMFLLVLGICQSSLLENVGEEEVNLIYRLPSDLVIPIAYKVHLQPCFEKLTFVGDVDITLIALKLTNNILILNSKELSIDNIKFVDLNTTKSFETEWITDESSEILIIMTKQQLQRQHHYSLQIKYSGTFMNRLPESYRSQIVKDGFTGHFALTHFKPTDARRAFPCWDEPIYKAKFKISLTHDKTLQAISNMDVLKREDRGDIVTTYFRETPPMSTHSVAFVISDYQFKESKFGNFTYRVWAKEKTLNQTGSALEISRKLLEQLNLYTNIPYQTYMPDKIDQILDDDILLENWGVVSYSGRSFLYDQALSTNRAKINILMGIANKLTHQWFGNLVTLKWWRSTGLNEGFPIYFQYFIVHQIAPKLRLNDTFVVEVMQQVMDIDGFVGVRLITQDGITTRRMFYSDNAVVYQKGASIIRMMSHALTEKYFHEGLKIYLKNYALGNADWNDLFESVEKGLPQNEKRRLFGVNTVKDILQNWVKSPAYPILTVTRVKNGYRLTQESFLFGVEEDDDYHSRNWWIPITYVEQSHPYFNETVPVEWMPSNKEYILPSSQESGWVIFNTQQTGYYRVNYDVQNWQLLMEELYKGENTTIHVLNRAQIVDDAFTLAKIGSLNYKVALDVIFYLTKETDYMPWQSAFRHLKFLRNKFRTPKQYHIFRGLVAYLMKGLTEKMGYEPKAHEPHLVKMLRVDAMKWACEAGVEECTSYAKKMYRQWFENPQMKLDVNLKKEILCAGIRKATERTWTYTLKYIITYTPDKDDRKNQLLPLACTNSPAILWKYLHSTLNSSYPIDFKTAAKDIMTRHLAGANLVLDFIQDRREDIVRLPDLENTMRVIADEVGAAFASYSPQLLKFGAFLLHNNLGHLWTLVTTQVNSNMIWINRYKSTVDEWYSSGNLLEIPDWIDIFFAPYLIYLEKIYSFIKSDLFNISYVCFLVMKTYLYSRR